MRKKASVSSRPSGSQSRSPAKSLPRSVAAAVPTEQAAGSRSESLGLGAGLLVVVELGGEWPSQATLATPVPGRRRVLAQTEGETPATFAERVASELESLFGRGVELETVVVACNERLDEPAASARRKTLSLALGSMAKNKRGRAYLAASARSGGRLRHALSALAQGLFDEWRTAGLEVSVDFGEETRAAAGAGPFAFTARVA
jgi:hypothetical protein